MLRGSGVDAATHDVETLLQHTLLAGARAVKVGTGTGKPYGISFRNAIPPGHSRPWFLFPLRCLVPVPTECDRTKHAMAFPGNSY